MDLVALETVETSGVLAARCGEVDVEVVALDDVDGVVLGGVGRVTSVRAGTAGLLDSIERQEAEMLTCAGLRISPRLADAEMLRTTSRLLIGAGPGSETSGGSPSSCSCRRPLSQSLLRTAASGSS